MANRADCPEDLQFGVYETLATAATALNRAKLSYAVGGAVAMFAGGYARNTTDVDVFVTDSDLEAVLTVLRRAGFQVHEVAESHYRAQLPKYSKMLTCVDVLVAWSAPEIIAVLHPTRRQVGAVRFAAFALHEIVASKVTVGVGTDAWVKAKSDILALHRAGLIDLPAIRRFLIDNDIRYVAEFDLIASEIAALRPNPGFGPRRGT